MDDLEDATVNVRLAEQGRRDLRPERMSRATERMTRRYASEILPIIGPFSGHPAPDVYTDAQTMA